MCAMYCWQQDMTTQSLTDVYKRQGHAQPETVAAKSARPSVLDSLKRPVPPRSPEKKPKQHEEVR